MRVAVAVPTDSFAALTAGKMSKTEVAPLSDKSPVDPNELLAALSKAEGIADRKDRLAFLEGAAAVAAERDPAGTIITLSVLPFAARCRTFPKVFERWSSRDPAAARLALSRLPKGELRDRSAAAVARGQVATDVNGAIRTAQGESDQVVRGTSLEAIARELATGPDGANKFAALLVLEGSDAQHALNAYLSELGERQPERSLEVLSRMRAALSAREAQALTNATFAQAAFQAPEAAFALAKTLPAGPERDAAFTTTVSYWLETDPAAALRSLAQLPADQRTALVGCIGGTLGYTQNHAVNEWLRSLPDEASRVDGVRSYVVGLAQRDPSAARAWMERLPAGAERVEAEFVLLTSKFGPGRIDMDESILETLPFAEAK